MYLNFRLPCELSKIKLSGPKCSKLEIKSTQKYCFNKNYKDINFIHVLIFRYDLFAVQRNLIRLNESEILFVTPTNINHIQ